MTSNGRQREAREHLIDFLSEDFHEFYDAILKPTVAEWRFQLQSNLHLTRSEMRGYQRAILAIENGLRSAFERQKLTVPDWFEREFPSERTG